MLNSVLIAQITTSILFLPIVLGQNSSDCDRCCGTANPVPFPFGFSPGCKIPLNCNDSVVRIHGFLVRNITAENLFIEIPVTCDRKIDVLKNLFGSNYALTWRNALLLQNCSSLLSGCVISTALLQERFNLHTCSNGSDKNISCFSNGTNSSNEPMTWQNVHETNCKFLFSSLVVFETNSPSISLDLQTLELEWWIDGNCNCSQNAKCIIVHPYAGKSAFRCSCNEGFEGDGFNAGNGCRKTASNCSPSNYLSGRCGGTTRVAALIGGLVAGASVMAALAVACYCVRKRSTSLRSQLSNRRLLSEAAGSCTVPLYPYREIEKATDSFSEKQRLGTGAYGTVYAGKLHCDEWVAIKRIRHRDAYGIEQVMNEIKLLSSVSHPHLVRLLGCCLERGEQILVYEFMPNGTLSQHLQRERGNGLPWTVRLTIAAETAKAVAHLHSAIHPPIYHRDIKSSNILLDYSFNSKVADFGLSRLGLAESSYISTAPQGTPGYLDPEYHQNFHLSDKSDVYSFGVVLVEIITALKVVDFSRDQSEVNLAALAVDKIGKGSVEEIVDPFLEPHSDAWTLSSINKVAELAFRCLAFHRDMRPSMMEVAAELDHIRFNEYCEFDERENYESACSSPSKRSVDSEKFREISTKTIVESRRLIVPDKAVPVISIMEEKESSPISVQDYSFSEHSSPSTNSLLGNDL